MKIKEARLKTNLHRIRYYEIKYLFQIVYCNIMIFVRYGPYAIGLGTKKDNVIICFLDTNILKFIQNLIMLW